MGHHWTKKNEILKHRTRWIYCCLCHHHRHCEPGRRWIHCHPCRKSGRRAQQRKAEGEGYQSTHYSQWTWGNDGVFLMFVKVRNYIFWLDDAFESAECDLPMVSYWLLENLRGKSKARIISTIVKTPSHCLTHHHPQLQLHHHVKVIWARESNVLMMIIRRVIYLL